jgi:hypothetical protein
MNGGDGLACKFGRDIRRDDCEPENLYVHSLTGRLELLKILPAVVTQSEVELLSSNGLLDGIGVAIQLVSDRCTYKGEPPQSAVTVNSRALG